MANAGPPAVWSRASARLLDAGRWGSGRRVVAIACITALVGVAVVGALHPMPAAGGEAPVATAAAAAAADAGAGLGGIDVTSGIDWPDLLLKGTICLALLFVTLRVLGRTGAGAPKRGSRLEVLESRPLAPKASLHLVAVGDRRLVVGLTPNGMVSLAELDASELEAEPAVAAEDASAAATPTFDLAGLLGRRPNGAPQQTIGSALDWLMRPIDAVTGRLAGFLSGGRVR